MVIHRNTSQILNPVNDLAVPIPDTADGAAPGLEHQEPVPGSTRFAPSPTGLASERARRERLLVPSEQSISELGPKTSARVKHGSEGKLRKSEWDSEGGVYKVHPAFIAVPFCGPVSETEREDLSLRLISILKVLEQQLDDYLARLPAGSAPHSTDHLSHGELTKNVLIPVKWILWDNPALPSKDKKELRCGFSKLMNRSTGELDKIGHVSLIGGTTNPEAYVGGLIFCTRNAGGKLEFWIDDDSGRFSEKKPNLAGQVEQVVRRYREFGVPVQNALGTKWSKDIERD